MFNKISLQSADYIQILLTYVIYLQYMTAHILNSLSNISNVHTNNLTTLQKHDAPQQVRWEMLIQICNIKFDNMVTNCLPLSYIITGWFKQEHYVVYKTGPQWHSA